MPIGSALWFATYILPAGSKWQSEGMSGADNVKTAAEVGASGSANADIGPLGGFPLTPSTGMKMWPAESRQGLPTPYPVVNIVRAAWLELVSGRLYTKIATPPGFGRSVVT